MSDRTASGGDRLRYGTWPSPVTAAAVAAGGIGIGGLARRGRETWWSELRPAETGRSVVVRLAGEPTDLLGPPWSARTRVHEYGGGAWWLGADAVYLANWDDQRLYRVDSDGGDPRALTPPPPTPAAWRYADGREHPTEPWVVCVRERHGDGDEPVNELVAIATDGDPDGAGAPAAVGARGARPPKDVAIATDGDPDDGDFARAGDPDEPAVVGAGPDDGAPVADFVAAPRFSADGRWLSWIRWDHPRMPWDGTELCVAPVFGGMKLGNVQVVAGNEHEAIHGADWTSDGRLVYSTDRSGYWNLYAWRPGSVDDEALTDLVGSEIGGPLWVFGVQRWAELSDGRLVVAVTTDAADRLAILDDGLTELDTDLVSIEGLAATEDGTIVVSGSTATTLTEISERALDGSVRAVLRPSDDVGIDPAWFSVARSIRYPSGEREAQAFYYPPTGPGIEAPPDERPPLIVLGHGGPTAHSNPALRLSIQYWTSRGFAVVDVNYGGSSGFGRAYRRLLDEAWGIVDVEDCIAAATHLADRDLADPGRMAIRGGSAGGFTVLSALVQSTVFSAGISLYGVADLEALARDTHKFESRYLDGLIGPYPERRDRYVERSPISHTDRLSCPLLVLQGTEDEVVPPSQSEAIVAALAGKGIPHAYVAFDGEQHGFRQEANIVRAYELSLWFYGRVFGFTPADDITPPEGAVGL